MAEVLIDLTARDVTDIKELLSEVFDWPPAAAERVDVRLPRVIIHPDAEIIVSRDANDRIVGTLLTNVMEGAVITRGEVHNLAVAEDFRGQGRSGAMLDLALDRFRQRGVERVLLTSRPEREAAHHLYASRGFKARATTPYRLDLT